jgi:hypothetical protein
MAQADDNNTHWPPHHGGWNEILRELPATADRTKARAEIEIVVADYHGLDDDEAARQHEHWRAMAKPSSFELLRHRARRVGPDLLAPNDPEWLSRLADDLTTKVRAVARARMQYYRPCGKRLRFDFGLCLVWIYNGGKKLPDSDEGPFVRFFCEIANRVLPGAYVTGRQVKRIAQRERQRSHFLFPVSLTASAPEIDAPALTINH